jgi:SAM-dependent methyltransferase
MKLVAGCGPKPVPDGWVGIDINPDFVQRARACSPGATVMVGDLLALPFDNDSVEEVVCWEVLEHIEQQDKVIDELARVCTPGATLRLSTPLMNVEKFLSVLSMNYRTSVLDKEHQNCLHPSETIRKVSRRFDIEQTWYAPEAFGLCVAAALVMDRNGVSFNSAGELVGKNADRVLRFANRVASHTAWLWRAINSVVPHWATKSICLSARCRKEKLEDPTGPWRGPHFQTQQVAMRKAGQPALESDD